MDPELPASIHLSEECLMLISYTSQSGLPTQLHSLERRIRLWSWSSFEPVRRQLYGLPIAYFSKKLLPLEVCYSTVEKECLAIIFVTHAFRVYLLGRPFIIQTDHCSLKWLDKLKDTNSHLTCCEGPPLTN